MIKVLVKNRLRALLGSIVGKGKGGTVKKASIAKIIGFILIYAYVAVVFLGITTGLSIALAFSLLSNDGAWLYFALFSLAALSVIFVLSIFETKSELFECKDNDLLLSMPIKPRDIVISRIVVVLVYNYITAAVVMLPAIIVYAIFTLDVWGILGGLLVSVLVPLLGTALASAVGYLLAAISRKIKNKTFFTVIFALAFLGLYFWGYSALLGSSDEEIIDFSAMIPQLRENAKILYFIGSASLLSPIPILAALVVSVGAAFIAYTAISHNYIRIISETSGASSKAYRAERLKSGSALSALVKKELRHLISNANYILNSCLGIVFMLVLAVAALFKRETLISICEELFGAQGAAAGVLSAGIIITLSMCCMSACSLSLEGKRLWILKSIPVTSKVAVLSKALPQVIITVPVSIISAIIITFATGAEFYFYPIAIVAVSAACVFYAFFGTILNVLFPKFEYENEVQPIKQSLSVFLAMMINMVMCMAVIVVSVILAFVSPILSALSVALIYTFLAVVAGLILLGPAAKKYETL